MKNGFSSPAEFEAYLAGAIGGDGHLNEYFIQLDDGAPEWLEIIAGFFEKLFCKHSRVRKKRGSNDYKMYICSKQLAKYFHDRWKIPFGKKSYSIAPPVDELIAKETRRAYLGGWFDAEAHVENWKKPRSHRVYRRIQFKTKSKAVRDFLHQILEETNVSASCFEDNEGSFRLQIGSKKAVEAFESEFVLMNPKKLAALNFFQVPDSTGSKSET